MSQLIESIWIKDQKRQNLKYHQARLEHACKHFFKSSCLYILDKIIDPYALQHEDVKCRFIYDASTYSLDYEIYKRRVIKKLKVINDDHILYPIKKFQRPELDRLFSLKEDTDEIIIVKKGLVTDAFYYNLVFEDHNGFYTPQACLLKGTMRQRLLDKNKISIKKIAIHDLAKYHRIHLINALNGLGSIVVETSDVIL